MDLRGSQGEVGIAQSLKVELALDSLELFGVFVYVLSIVASFAIKDVELRGRQKYKTWFINHT